MKKNHRRAYISERIINISKLEKLLQEESILIQAIKREQKVESKVNVRLLDELEAKNKEAVAFEFCIERRKTR